MEPCVHRAALALWILVALARAGVAAPAASETADWSAGIASIKITPEKPVPLAGYAARIKPFETIDLDIYAKALALQDAEGKRAMLLTIDLCVMPRDVGQMVRKRIAQTTGIEESSILLNIAHSHSAPAVSLEENPVSNAAVPNSQGTLEYTKWLCDRLVDAAAQAAGRMQPARLSWGVGVASFVMNRREFTDKGVILGNNPRGMVDRSVPVLRIDGADGKPRAVIFGYACHNTTMPSNRLAISGDYEGFAKEYVQQQFPGIEAMYMTGCAGDSNPYPRTGYQWAKDHGQTLGAEVCRVMQTRLQPIHGPLKCAAVTAALPLQTPDRAALQVIIADAHGKGLKQESAKQMLTSLDAGGKLPVSYEAPVEAWQFGRDLTLVALPEEVVVQYALDVERAVGPLRLWVSGYNQEVAGYIPSARIVKEGGYETRGLYFGTGWFAPGVEDALTAAARDAAAKAGRDVSKAE